MPLFSPPTTPYRDSGIRHQPPQWPSLTPLSLKLFLSPIFHKHPHPSTCRRLEATNFSQQIKLQKFLSTTKLRRGTHLHKCSKLMDWKFTSFWENPGKNFVRFWNNKFEVASNHSPPHFSSKASFTAAAKSIPKTTTIANLEKLVVMVGKRARAYAA